MQLRRTLRFFNNSILSLTISKSNFYKRFHCRLFYFMLKVSSGKSFIGSWWISVAYLWYCFQKYVYISVFWIIEIAPEPFAISCIQFYKNDSTLPKDVRRSEDVRRNFFCSLNCTLPMSLLTSLQGFLQLGGETRTGLQETYCQYGFRFEITDNKNC